MVLDELSNGKPELFENLRRALAALRKEGVVVTLSGGIKKPYSYQFRKIKVK